MSQQLNLELTKVQGAILCPFDMGNGKQQDFICLPVGQNNVKLVKKQKDDGTEEKRVFWGLSIFKSKQFKESKLANFFSTHFIKPYVGKDEYNSMSEEQRKAIPILGDILTHKDELNAMQVAPQQYGGYPPQGGYMPPQQPTYIPPQQQGYYPPQQPQYGGYPPRQ